MTQTVLMPTFGEILKIAREKAMMSQDRLAAAAKLSKGAVQNIESGKTVKAGGATVWAILKALDYESVEQMAVASGATKAQPHPQSLRAEV